jgi:hypothetical protein
MPINKHFTQYSYGREQDVVEDLAIEAIKQYGYSVRYIPRTVIRNDPLFGEDTLSRFEAAAEIEIYIGNVEGFDGEGDLLSKFNLEIRDAVTLSLAKKRFEQARTEKLTSEVGWNFVLESANTNAPSRFELGSESGEYGSIVMETATSEGYNITSERPLEGDLIYEPFSRSLFEIKFVEHETPFYQLGRLPMYEIRCEMFEYSHEVFATGNTEIDAIEQRYTMDIMNFEMQLEDGFKLLREDGGSYLQEFKLEEIDPTANNEYLQAKDTIFSGIESIIDWTEKNPFSENEVY